MCLSCFICQCASVPTFYILHSKKTFRKSSLCVVAPESFLVWCGEKVGQHLLPNVDHLENYVSEYLYFVKKEVVNRIPRTLAKTPCLADRKGRQSLGFDFFREEVRANRGKRRRRSAKCWWAKACCANPLVSLILHELHKLLPDIGIGCFER